MIIIFKMVFFDVYDIEPIETCQQNMFKITTLNDGVYYYKKYINNQSWWTLDNENICQRELYIHRHLYFNGIPTAEFKACSLDSFVTEEVKNTVSSATGATSTIHYHIGSILKKIHSLGVVHGDFHHQNILIDIRKQEVAAIIDFEESVFYKKDNLYLPHHLKPDPMYDLATFLRSLRLFYPINGEEYWRSFLKGYGLDYHLTEGIEFWLERIDERNQFFKKWAKENNVESIIC